MKKISFILAIGASSLAFAQLGKIGVNTTDPKATLDIEQKSGNTTTNEGLLIPRLNISRVKAIATSNRVEGTLVYVIDNVTSSDSATFTGTGKGFYYYDAATQRWVKVKAGADTATTPTVTTPVVQAFTKDVTINADTDFAIYTPDSGTAVITMPTTAVNGKKICIWNNSQYSDLTFTVQPPGQHGVVFLNTGACYVHYNNVWYSVSAY